MERTQTEMKRAHKKIEIAIDKMIDLQNMGLGNEKITRILEMLNAMLSEWGTT